MLVHFKWKILEEIDEDNSINEILVEGKWILYNVEVSKWVEEGIKEFDFSEVIADPEFILD